MECGRSAAEVWTPCVPDRRIGESTPLAEAELLSSIGRDLLVQDQQAALLRVRPGGHGMSRCERGARRGVEGARRSRAVGATSTIVGLIVLVAFCGAAEAACVSDAATLFSCLGIAQNRELTTDTGRPVQLFREGKVLGKVLA